MRPCLISLTLSWPRLRRTPSRIATAGRGAFDVLSDRADPGHVVLVEI
jgi:hypothetical protein